MILLANMPLAINLGLYHHCLRYHNQDHLIIDFCFEIINEIFNIFQKNVDEFTVSEHIFKIL